MKHYLNMLNANLLGWHEGLDWRSFEYVVVSALILPILSVTFQQNSKFACFDYVERCCQHTYSPQNENWR